MIPFGSQRASGQDLATHLLNALDNERLELAQVRGAIARDLHGAFAEWEAQAHALTRCRKYLYSLSVNPDPRQGGLTRAQYLDYIARVEERLGLSGQPRAIIFHQKHGREHCHVVWSRIDARNGRAVQISYDREKLMAVTREFAHDHGLSLPDGYHRDRDGAPEEDSQLSLYDKHQQDVTGITKEERVAEVTDAWRRSDSARAFVRALEEQGYILATGRRDYVLVDRYGHMNALPRLIADVRTRQLREFLGSDYPTSALPSVEEARAQATRRREAVAEHERELEHLAQQEAQAEAQRAALALKQASRRQAVKEEAAALAAQQRADRHALEMRQHQERAALKSDYLAGMRRVREDRLRNRTTGLAAFLGRVTGIALITKKVRRYRDRQRFYAFLADKAALRERQRREQATLALQHELQLLDMRRRYRALRLIARRELRTLELTLLRKARLRTRNGPVREPRGRQVDDSPASAFRQEWIESAGPAGKKRALRKSSTGTAGDGDGKAGGHGGEDELVPAAEDKTRRRKRRRRRRRDRGKQARAAGGHKPKPAFALGAHFTQASRNKKTGGDTGERDSFGAPKPAAETTTRRRRRRKIELEPVFNSAADPRRRRGSDAFGGPDPPSHRRPDETAAPLADDKPRDDWDEIDEFVWADEPDGPSDEEIDEMLRDDSNWTNEPHPEDDRPRPKPKRKRHFRPKP